jgi:hypothetical protein
MLLNFNAISMPHIGSWILVLAVVLAAVALYLDKKNKTIEVSNA